ncbi:putative transmembrane protein [Toxoplasma gondii p89]|uniref:Putative transmembrane protein n=1 Tax=Toxoplasma gondii p89 TaxID=943119 RepID=A0A086KCE7_TOXGO|nr:putative transmembrane protein [Toxoplasma gondii p89]
MNTDFFALALHLPFALLPVATIAATHLAIKRTRGTVGVALNRCNLLIHDSPSQETWKARFPCLPSDRHPYRRRYENLFFLPNSQLRRM